MDSQGALRDPGLCCATPLAYRSPPRTRLVEQPLTPAPGGDSACDKRDPTVSPLLLNQPICAHGRVLETATAGGIVRLTPEGIGIILGLVLMPREPATTTACSPSHTRCGSGMFRRDGEAARGLATRAGRR